MISSDEEFHQWLLATFREESDEILTEISNGLIGLEKADTSGQAELIEQIFRKTHSLKGAARAVNLRDIESVCQNIENVFSAIKRDEVHLDAEIFDLLHRSLTVISALLADDTSADNLSAEIVHSLRTLIAERKTAEYRSVPGVNPDPHQPESLHHEMVSVSSGSRVATSASFAAESLEPGKDPSQFMDFSKSAGLSIPYMSVSGTETVRIAAHKLDRLVSGSDDLLSTRLNISHRIRELEEMMSTFSLWKWNHTQIEGDLHQIREITYGAQKARLPPEILLPLERLVNFIKFDQEFFANLQHDLAVHIRATELDRSVLESSTSEISDLIHDAVLLPLSAILSPFSKFVREYSRSVGKKVDLIIEGENIEMDRRILEALKPSLMHLIHNCIDHGFETPGERVKLGKPDHGCLTIRITPHSGSKVEIDVIDDGSGIDRDQIRKVAIEKGVITERQGSLLTDDEALWLIFRSGMSTCGEVTDLSGRGLGLAIVEDTVTRLGGDIMIASHIQKGTTITIVLPVKMATLRGVVVKAGSQTFVIPIQQVKQVIRAPSRSFYVQGSRMVTQIEGSVYRVVILAQILGVPDTSMVINGQSPVPIVTIEYGGRTIACVVDDVIRVQEIIVSPLGNLLRRVKRITGAVLLGDGSIAMVLDPMEIIQEAFTVGRQAVPSVVKTGSKKQILVVEDSVTSRALLQHILEKEGYQVYTAIDGIDAFAKLKLYEFDMVVSDVDMPRMSGFTLTEKIRADDRFSNIIVALVTSLDTPQDREHGMAVGADAYIVKSSFETASFLTTISNLLYVHQ